MGFVHEVAVRFGDTDALGHVNNARVLSYLEDARLAFFNTRMPGVMDSGLVVVRIEVDYLRPLYYDRDRRPLQVSVDVRRVGTSSLTLSNEIRQADVATTRAEVVMVSFDAATGRSRPLSEEQRVALNREAPPGIDESPV